MVFQILICMQLPSSKNTSLLGMRIIFMHAPLNAIKGLKQINCVEDIELLQKWFLCKKSDFFLVYYIELIPNLNLSLFAGI